MALDQFVALTNINGFSAYRGITLLPSEISRVENFIHYASESIQSYLNRRLPFMQNVEERLDGFGWPRVRLSRTPVVRVHGIRSGSEYATGTDKKFNLRQNEARDGFSGLVELCCSPFTGKRQAYYTNDQYPDTESQFCMIAMYDGGYNTSYQFEIGTNDPDAPRLPWDIELAANILTDIFLQQSGGISPSPSSSGGQIVTQESLMSHSISWGDAGSSQYMRWQPKSKSGALPDQVLALVSKYRRLPQY